LPEEDPIKLWQHIHGASAHFPIALLIVSVLFDIGSSWKKHAGWRTVGFWAIIVAAIVAVPALASGLSAYFGWFGIHWEGDKIMLLHRNIALGAGGTCIALALWRSIRHDDLKGGTWVVYLGLAILSMLGIGYTGYLGAYVAQGY
jgi:uncharacterized membrane protein